MNASVPEPISPLLLEIHCVGKTYRSGDRDLTVLRDVSLSVREGDTCAIVGPSGSGKTTLLGLCAGLDDASTGSVKLGGQALESLDEDARAALRNRLVGFVFQSFQLLPTLTALENVLVPLELRGESGRQREAAELLARVGLGDRLGHYPLQLSGGEQQRVALARAFIHRPRLLFADEPTGNLDAETSAPVVEMLFALNREAGTALVLVTHDLVLAGRARRVVTMRSGAIVSEVEKCRELSYRAAGGRRSPTRGRGAWPGVTAAASARGSSSSRWPSWRASPRW